MVAGPLRVFLSYAHADEVAAAELRAHLAPLRYDGVVEDWYDHDLVPGSLWDAEIQQRLEHSHLVLVLLSADFLASSYGYGKELTRALALHDQHALVVIPVVLRNCLWQRLPIGRVHALPAGARPVESWARRDDAWVSVVAGVESAARELLARSRDLIDDWLQARLIRRRVLREVQGHLAARGFYHGPIDGVPGRMTEKAVVAFQRDVGIAVDARIGPEVIRHLQTP